MRKRNGCFEGGRMNLIHRLIGLLSAIVAFSVFAQDAHHHPANELGSTAAFDAQGRLWVAYKEDQHVLLEFSDDLGQHFSAPIRINATPEAVSADGENRPKLTFGSNA